MPHVGGTYALHATTAAARGGGRWRPPGVASVLQHEMAEEETPETLVAYYAHNNMSRVEKQVVAHCDGRPLASSLAAPFAPFEKLVEVIEHGRVTHY